MFAPLLRWISCERTHCLDSQPAVFADEKLCMFSVYFRLEIDAEHAYTPLPRGTQARPPLTESQQVASKSEKSAKKNSRRPQPAFESSSRAFVKSGMSHGSPRRQSPRQAGASKTGG